MEGGPVSALEQRVLELDNRFDATERQKQELQELRLREVQELARVLAPMLGSPTLAHHGYKKASLRRCGVLRRLWYRLRYGELYTLSELVLASRRGHVLPLRWVMDFWGLMVLRRDPQPLNEADHKDVLEQYERLCNKIGYAP